MLSKYRITIEEIYTGREVMEPVECNGFLIQGYLGERDKDGCYQGVRTRIHEASKADMANGFYHEKNTKEAMLVGAKAARKYERAMWWRRLFGKGDGE